LLVDADWAGMAHSLEIRVPLVDVELLRQAAPWLARHPDITKQEVARAAAPQLPASLFDRPKIGFNVPVRQWLGAAAGSSLSGWSRQVHDHQALRASRKPRVLISTLAPHDGGVPAMVRFAADALEQQGFEPVCAFHVTYSVQPELSVPSFKLLQRRPGHRVNFDDKGRELHAFGAWLPELEFTHYLPTRGWRRLMDSCDAFIAITGNVLPATPFLLTGRPYVSWTSTDWDGDRRARVRHFPWLRRLLDTCVNAPVIRYLERRLLRGGRIVSVSEHTARVLQRRADIALPRVLLPVPVDVEAFVPAPASRVAGRIGFAGRINDPRKNIGLLLAATARLRTQGCDVHVVLMGDAPDEAIRNTAAQLGLQAHVSFHPNLPRSEMRDLMQTLDVFVVASHQEGLCISALEAMACGVPVVCTRCGGPEEFVIGGVSGELVDSAPEAIADAVARIMNDEVLRASLSSGARRLVEERYAPARARAVLLQQLRETFPASAGRAEPALSA
jgi:glycosyltransferase involved in cell wall biosynthesis